MEATCTTPKTCSVCKKTAGEELGHITTSNVCSRCNETIGAWTIDYFVDEFYRPTENEYIQTIVEGVFSNSATTASDLLAGVALSSITKRIGISLYEYGYYEVKNNGEDIVYSVTMLDSDGGKYYFYARMEEGSSNIIFDEDNSETIIEVLKQPGEVSFRLDEYNNPTTNYIFTVDTSNFATLYDQLFA